MCQHIGRRSSNVSFERKDWRSIRLLSTDLGLVAKAGVIAGLWIGVVQGLWGVTMKLWIVSRS